MRRLLDSYVLTLDKASVFETLAERGQQLCSHDGTIRLWDVKTGAESAHLEGHSGLVHALCVLPDGRLASGSRDKTIRLWEIAARREIARLETDNGVGCLAALLDGRLVAGDANGCLHWLEIIA